MPHSMLWPLSWTRRRRIRERSAPLMMAHHTPASGMNCCYLWAPDATDTSTGRKERLGFGANDGQDGRATAISLFRKQLQKWGYFPVGHNTPATLSKNVLPELFNASSGFLTLYDV